MHATSLIDVVYDNYMDNGNHSMIDLFATAEVNLSNDYRALLRVRRPRAIAILARLLVVTALPEFKGVWWLWGGLGKKVSALKNLMSEECRWAIKGPWKVAEG